MIFALVLIMTIQISGSLGTQLERAAVRSELVPLTRERLDSLMALDFDSLTVGTVADTVTVRRRRYERSWTVSAYHPLLYEISISLTPLVAGTGPSYSADAFRAGDWNEN